MQRTNGWLLDGRGSGVDGKGQGMKKYKLVDTEQPWGCKVQLRECSQYSNNCDGARWVLEL